MLNTLLYNHKEPFAQIESTQITIDRESTADHCSFVASEASHTGATFAFRAAFASKVAFAFRAGRIGAAFA